MSSCSESEAESSDDGSVVESGVENNNIRWRRVKLFFALQSILSLEGDRVLPTYSSRKGNMRRDRSAIIKWAAELDDKMFARQFCLCREDFFYILSKITIDLKKDMRQAKNSSGSAIRPELMLMITLRILAGASYLDMIHYRVHVDSVGSIVWDTVLSIHKRIDNVRIANSEQECLRLAKDWAAIQLIRWGHHLTAGTMMQSYICS